MYASLNDTGKMAVVLDTGAVSRGSGSQGSNKERNIRKRFVDDDLVEAVILLPENLFYNTIASGIILVISRKKRHKGEIAIINGSKQFERGRPKNHLSEQNILNLSEAYEDWTAVDGLSAIVTCGQIADNDYSISPGRFVSNDAVEDTLSLEDSVLELRTAEDELDAANSQLQDLLRSLGFK